MNANVLEEAAAKRNLEETQGALLNLLEDLTEQQGRFEEGRRAMVNIIEDLTAEQSGLEARHRALVNILEDFDLEKRKVEALNVQLQREVEERQRAQEEIRNLNRALELRVIEQGVDLASSNRELAVFSYSASHDLRAPLRAMDGFCQALLEDYADRLDDDGKDLLRRVRAASQHTDRLIDGLLELSQTVRSEIRRASVDLSTMAQTIALELQKSDPVRRVEFAVSPGLAVNADPKMMRIVLEKLLGNAWKFTSKHQQARIEVGTTEHEGERAYFVRDDGAGFDMRYADKLFGPFQRLHAQKEFEGTGIGLATVQRIIDRHGGRLWAEGKVEQGATVFMTVPDGSKVSL